jgi:hypothetical protein
MLERGPTIRVKGVDMDRDDYQPLRELRMLKSEMETWVDHLEGDTWGWNKWYLLMQELLQYKEGGPPNDDTDPNDIVKCQYQGSKEHGWEPGEPYDWVPSKWPETVVWDADDLRELIGQIEHCMFEAVHQVYIPMVQHHLCGLIEDTEKSLGIPTDDEYLQQDYDEWKAKHKELIAKPKQEGEEE